MEAGGLGVRWVGVVGDAYDLGVRGSFALARPLGGIRHLHALPF